MQICIYIVTWISKRKRHLHKKISQDRKAGQTVSPIINQQAKKPTEIATKMQVCLLLILSSFLWFYLVVFISKQIHIYNFESNYFVLMCSIPAIPAKRI